MKRVLCVRVDVSSAAALSRVAARFGSVFSVDWWAKRMENVAHACLKRPYRGKASRLGRRGAAALLEAHQDPIRGQRRAGVRPRPRESLAALLGKLMW